MKVFSFDIMGDFALFKKNDANDILYISYNFIHKPAVLGTLGAIIGYKGYSLSDKKSPAYYEKLKKIKLAIYPYYKNPLKKVITVFNNASCLGASNTKGGGEISNIQEQILVGEPIIKYKILILEDEVNKEQINKLKEKLKNNETEYPLYFGKNEFFAYYDNYKEYECASINNNTTIKINSLFKQSNVTLKKLSIEKDFDPFNLDETEGYSIYERLPYDFDENGFYLKDLFLLSDRDVIINKNDAFYKVYNDKESFNVQFI